MRRLPLLALAALAVAGGLYWAWSGSDTAAPARLDRYAALLAELEELPGDGFPGPPPGWTPEFPRDHGDHAGSRMESWALAAHLTTADGETLGLQLSFLRLGIVAPGAPAPRSIWEVRELDRAHVALVAAAGAQAIGEERFGRGIPGLGGYDATEGAVRLDGWFLRFDSDEARGHMTLHATVSDKAGIDLTLRAEKPVLALAPEGAPFAGYAFPRLSAQGTIDRGNGTESVTGTAWLDHLWGELPLPGSRPVATDRLQLQLDDGTDLSLIRTRRADGTGPAALDGFAVAPDGTASALDGDSLRMTARRIWRDPVTGTDYPVSWQIEGPGLDLVVEPLVDAQAFDTAVPVWSGTVRARGRHAGAETSGGGTLQLTGYGAR